MAEEIGFDGASSLVRNLSAMFMQDNNKYTVSYKNGNYTEVTENKDSDWVTTKYGNTDYNYALDDMGELNFYKILRQHKLYVAYNVNHTIPNIINRKEGQITRLQLGAAKAELAIPEDVSCVCIDNSSYIYKDDYLYIELHGSKSENVFIAIDYAGQSTSIMSGKANELILFADFHEDPEHLRCFGGEHFKIDYIYEGGIVSETKTAFESKQYEFDVFAYRADILDEDENLEKIIGIIPIPYIIKEDDIAVFSQDHLCYMTYIIEFNDDSEVEVYNKYYQEFTPEEAKSVKDFWEGLIKAEEQ